MEHRENEGNFRCNYIHSISGRCVFHVWIFYVPQDNFLIPVEFETVPVEEGNLVSTISAAGKVRSKQSTSLQWKTSGIVEAVNVGVGDQVETGMVLASLSQTSLPQSVILAQADLVNA